MFSTSMYGQQTSPDLIGSAQKGFSLGQMYKKNKLQDAEREKQAQAQQAFSGYINADEQNKQASFADLAKMSPEMAYKIKQDEMNMMANQKKIEQDANDRRFNRGIKNKELALKEREFSAKNGEGLKNNEELMVPSFGLARTKKEAQELRAAQSDATEAMALIDKVKELGKNVSIFDRERIGKIDSAKKILAGKLRLPLTGPGAMTEDEFNRLIETMGDPSDVFSTEKIQNAKLDQLKEVLGNSVVSKFKSSGAGPEAQFASNAFSINPKTKAPNLKKPIAELTDQELDELEKYENYRRGVAGVR